MIEETRLQDARRNLEIIQREAEKRITAARNALEKAQKEGHSLEKYQAELDRCLRVQGASVENAQRRLKEAEAVYESKASEIAKHETAQADARESAMRAKALRVFLANGGRREEFSNHWPSIREGMLRQSVLDDLEEESTNRPRTVITSL